MLSRSLATAAGELLCVSVHLAVVGLFLRLGVAFSLLLLTFLINENATCVCVFVVSSVADNDEKD